MDPETKNADGGGLTSKPLMPAANDAQEANPPVQSQLTPPLQKSSTGTPVLFIVGVGLLLVLGGVYAYTSNVSWQPKYPDIEIRKRAEPLPEPVVVQPVEEPPPPPPVVVEDTFKPTAIVDVPNVGLRRSPSFSAKVASGKIKRGERVEVLKEYSGDGPDWVQIRTRSGKTGWVFASVIKQRKGR